MLDLLTIEKNPELLESQDYALLRRTGIEHIEALARELWTDYNVHDPGISFLELLCYAITDLGYRTDYDIKDLLTRLVDGEPVNTSTFHTAHDIFPCNPVTFDDLRKLLIDIEGVRNAWIDKHTSVVYCLDTTNEELIDCPAGASDGQKNDPLNGLYDVFIEYEDFVEDERIVHVGELEQTAALGGYIPAGGRGIAFRVEYGLVMEAVSVYAHNAIDPAPDNPTQPVDVTLSLFDEGGTLLREVVDHTIDTPGEKTRIPLGFEIEPGDYRLVATGAQAELYREETAAYPFSIENVLCLVSGVQGQTPNQTYGFFYDWEVSYAVPPPAQISEYSGELVIEPVGLEENDSPGGYIAPQDRGIVFNVEQAMTLEAVSVYADAAGTVTVRLLDEDDLVLESVDITIDAAGEKTRVPLWFELAPCWSYRLDAQGTAINLYRTQNAAFPFVLDNVITLQEGFQGPTSYYFFYDWEVSYTALPVQASGLTRADVLLEVRHRLHAYRNLCEDFVNICELEEEEIAVCADIEIAPSADVEEVLAEIFYQVGLHISPPVRFYTIDELLDKGKTTDEIFEGPLLDHGFIDHDEFLEIKRLCRIRTSDIIQIIMDVAGVTAVKEISLISFLSCVDGEIRDEDEWILDLADDRFRAPTFSPDCSKVIFYKNDLPYYANRGQVGELLAEKKAQDLQTKLKGHEQDLPVPVGEYKDLEDYYPVQNELPPTYMVGQIRVPDSFSAQRKAQARQLKAYLLFFEQLLANYLSQLAHVEALFSWDPGEARTYFTQPVEEITDIEELYLDHPSLTGKLESIIEDADTAQERKLRLLDHLVARFAESFADYSLLMFNLLGEDDGATRVIADKQCFLMDYPAVSRERGKAFDYRYPDEKDNLSGYQRRVYRLLGIRDAPLPDADGLQCDATRRNFAGHLFEIVQDGTTGLWHFILNDEDGDELFRSIGCETEASIEGLLDFALTIGGDEANYVLNSTDNVYELMRTCKGEGEDEPIGNTTSDDKLAEVVAYFAAYAEAEGFHVVEHILLRKRTEEDPFLPVQLDTDGDCTCASVREPYSFRMSVILPSWPARFRDIKFRQFVEETLRTEAPAHIFPRICWVSHSQMKAFEQCHDDWLGKLAALDSRLGRCCLVSEADEETPVCDDRSGQLPLPATEVGDEAYRDCLADLIEKLHTLNNVYPLARLYDCEETDGDAPQISLNNTSLGAF